MWKNLCKTSRKKTHSLLVLAQILLMSDKKTPKSSTRAFRSIKHNKIFWCSVWPVILWYMWYHALDSCHRYHLICPHDPIIFEVFTFLYDIHPATEGENKGSATNKITTSINRQRAGHHNQPFTAQLPKRRKLYVSCSVRSCLGMPTCLFLFNRTGPCRTSLLASSIVSCSNAPWVCFDLLPTKLGSGGRWDGGRRGQGVLHLHKSEIWTKRERDGLNIFWHLNTIHIHTVCRCI